MGQFNMKIGLYFTFIFLVTFTTINAGSKLKSFLKIPPKAVTRTCSCKIKGVQYKIRNVPTKCCSNGRIKWNIKSKKRSGYCQESFCPLLKALKGCNFMCNFYLCNQNKGGEAKCKKSCKKPTSTKGLTMTTSTVSPNVTSTSPTTRTTKSLCPVQVAIFGCKVVCTNQRTKKCRDYYGGKNECMDQCMQRTTSATNSTAPSTPSTKPTTSTTKPTVSTTKPTTSTTKSTASTTKSTTSTTKPTASTTKPTISTKKSSNTKPTTSTIKSTASTTKPTTSTIKPTASNTKPTASSAKAGASNSSASTTKTPKGTINPTKTSAKTKLATKPKSKNNTKLKPKPKFKL